MRALAIYYIDFSIDECRLKDYNITPKFDSFFKRSIIARTHVRSKYILKSKSLGAKRATLLHADLLSFSRVITRYQLPHAYHSRRSYRDDVHRKARHRWLMYRLLRCHTHRFLYAPVSQFSRHAVLQTKAKCLLSPTISNLLGQARFYRLRRLAFMKFNAV